MSVIIKTRRDILNSFYCLNNTYIERKDRQMLFILAAYCTKMCAAWLPAAICLPVREIRCT